MPTVTMVNPRGTTQDVAEPAAFEHYLRRGFTPQAGTVTDARTLLTGRADAPAPLASPALAPRMALPAQRVSRQITAFQPGHGWTVSNAGGATWNLNDTSDAALGSQCVSVTTGTTGARTELSSGTVAAFDATTQALKVWVKFDPATAANLMKITVYIGQDATNGYTVDVWNNVFGAVYDPVTGWAVFNVDTAFASTFNTPTGKTAMTNVRLWVYGKNGVAAKVYFGGVGLVPKTLGACVTFGWDDGYADQFTAARPKLDQYGYPATAYVIGDNVATGTGGTYMTLAQLHALEDLSGWEVAAHSATLTDHNLPGALTDLGETQLRANLEGHKRWLLDEGFRGADHFAYPQGKYTEATVSVVRDYFTTARTTLTGNALELAVPAYPLRMRCVPIQSGDSLATLTAHVDRAKANGDWVQFYCHRVTAAPAGVQTTPAVFNGLVDYVAAQAVPVRTVGDVVERGRVGVAA